MPNQFAICLFVLTCAAGAQQVQGPKQQNQKPASVEGVVVNDLTREPIRRAEVLLSLMKPGTQMGPNQPSSAVTDAEGRFRVTELEAGQYVVYLRRQGFVMAGNASAGSAIRLQLTAGQELKGLRYTLTPQAVIAGRVFDDEGEPAQGAQVTVLRPRRIRGKNTWLPDGQNVRTNDKGEFRVANIQAGRYVVMAQAWMQVAVEAGTAQRPATSYVATFYPGVTEATQATMVEATPGAELTGFDITLKRVPVFKVRGKVLTAEGQPAKNFHASMGSREGGVFGVAGRMTQGKEDGSFEMTGVPNGAWVLIVNSGRGGPPGGPGDQQTTTVPVEVANQDIEGLEVRFTPPFTLQGNVVVEAATDEQKAVLSGFNVSLQPEANTFVMGGQPARTQADGSFSLRVGSPGKYILNAYNPSATGLYLAAVRFGNENHLFRPVDLSGGSAGPVKIVFRGDGGKVSGNLDLPEEKKSHGEGMAVLIPVDPELRSSTMGRNVRMVDQNGGFQFDSVRPGEYYLAVTTTSDYSAVQDIDQAKDFDSKATKVKVVAGGSTSVQVKPLEPADK
ncbi:carboxypeptidase-like regulatory domain-containing protein [Paludibaculum fermentans]|uniref:Carboxypeptidase regulatory-like domain-containing protein n=1 Tax=Paludibaculum fermentans TaxID=1473598 RepID=A0A7S7NXF1_PALFE|nr:carboxypeptidase-like regulatory domain-containing protein [Paludibaculum fermentans]QOY91534.1 carboxypeptidase regulatory-like domain-containing protein [Paludibaculum fermentans]